MKKLILMLVVFISTLNTISYGATKKKVASNSNTPQKVAENFVNGYAIRSENKNKDNWVLKNSNITENFRNIYEELVEYRNSFDWDGETMPIEYLGVPMDGEWILTGQDPDTNGGYKAIYYDEDTGYVILKSRNVHRTYVKIVNINGNWYVDGQVMLILMIFQMNINKRLYN